MSYTFSCINVMTQIKSYFFEKIIFPLMNAKRLHRFHIASVLHVRPIQKKKPQSTYI
jgi:hypothetical protein